MEQEKFKKLVSTMVIIIMTGGVEDRIRYLGTVIDHMIYHIRTEKLAKDQAGIMNTRQQLIGAFNYIVIQNAEKFQLSTEQVRKIQDSFRTTHITLDASLDTPQSKNVVQTLREIESLMTARMYYFRAVESYSDFLRGSADGLTNATINAQAAMSIVLDVCYDNNFVDISDGEFRKAMTAHPAPSQPVDASSTRR